VARGVEVHSEEETASVVVLVVSAEAEDAGNNEYPREHDDGTTYALTLSKPSHRGIFLSFGIRVRSKGACDKTYL
jgi:hypothetical protein